MPRVEIEMTFPPKSLICLVCNTQIWSLVQYLAANMLVTKIESQEISAGMGIYACTAPTVLTGLKRIPKNMFV